MRVHLSQVRLRKNYQLHKRRAFTLTIAQLIRHPNPLYVLTNDPYTPAQKTVVNWGVFGVAGLNAFPEHGYYV